MTVGDTKRLIMDDGKFTTGRKITKFEIWPDSPGNTGEVGIIMSVNDTVVPTAFDASDSRQIAWGYRTADANGVAGDYQFVLDPDHIIVRDAFLTAVGTAEIEVNYLVQMEFLKITDTECVLQLIKERQQDDLA
jgi:hypothetical protein